MIHVLLVLLIHMYGEFTTGVEPDCESESGVHEKTNQDRGANLVSICIIAIH